MNCPSNANKVTIRQNGLRGSTGAQGAQGIQGVQGIQGLQGVSGSQGIQGIQGTQGELGTQGLQGVQGSKGSQGTQGIQGFAGSQGIQGIQGLTGGTGPVGSQGATGPSGDAGVQGTIGTQGTVGSQGAQGVQGTTGTQGLTGTQGTVGAQGTDGPQGTQGIQGLTGVQGSTGVQGGQGTQGITGIQGAQGTQGIQGSQASVAILDENVSVVTSAISLDFSGSAVSASHVGNAVTVHVDTDAAGLFGDPYVLSTGGTYRTKTFAASTTLEYPGTPYSSSADFTATGGPNYTAFQRNGGYDGTVKLDFSITISGSTNDLFSQTGSYMEFTIYGTSPGINGVIHGGPSENKKHSVNISQIGTVNGNISAVINALGDNSGSYYYISNLIVTPVNTTF